jgi:IS5 family transposase
LSAAGDPLERLAVAVDFELFRGELEAALRRSDRSRGGRPPYDAVLMFKLLVLQTLYTLSDEQAEYQLRDRLSFLRFVGLALHEPVPDAKTVWLFREQLTRAGAIERLFARFDAVLREQGILAPRPAMAGRPFGDGSSAPRSMGGQIVDATIVQARPARLTAEEKAAVRQGDTPADWSPARRAQIDREARWTLRRGRKRPPPEPGSSTPRQATAIAVPVFGYKNHVGIDRRHGLIRTWTVTHAAAHDGGQLGALLDPGNTASGVPPPSADGGRFAAGSIACRDRWADTAYRSAANLALLAKRAMTAHLQRAKPRGKPMPAHIKRGNARRGKVRAAVEHVFAAQKQRLRLIVRTIGLARATAKIGLANLAYNLLRFTWLQGRAAPA